MTEAGAATTKLGAQYIRTILPRALLLSKEVPSKLSIDLPRVERPALKGKWEHTVATDYTSIWDRKDLLRLWETLVEGSFGCRFCAGL